MSMSTPMSSQVMPGSYSQLSGSSICSATHAAVPSARSALSRSVKSLDFRSRMLRWRSFTSRLMAATESAYFLTSRSFMRVRASAV